ncbi:hypothetical protein A5883_003534 [Enterococcus sp. 5B3_DIV0040]|nr:hypothetical protein A5883_003534 [Enterococcus sp. 5B3_DIV0040]
MTQAVETAQKTTAPQVFPIKNEVEVHSVSLKNTVKEEMLAEIVSTMGAPSTKEKTVLDETIGKSQ